MYRQLSGLTRREHMDNDNNQKSHFDEKQILLLILCVLLFFVLTGFISFVIKTKRFANTYVPLTEEEFMQMREEERAGDQTDPAADDIDLSIVPDYLSERGIIFRGPLNVVNSKCSYRCCTYGTDDWRVDYVSSQSLKVESTDEEFEEFCSRFSFISEPDFRRFNGMHDYAVDFRGEKYNNFGILRTCLYTGDISEGYSYVEGDPGYSIPIYIDPTGKYILSESSNIEIDDDTLLEFLEPMMTEMILTYPELYGAQRMLSDDPETVKLFVGGLHELECTLTEEDASKYTDDPLMNRIEFTDENGKSHIYFFNKIVLVDGDKVYDISSSDTLFEVMNNAELKEWHWEPDFTDAIDAP